MFRAVTAMHTYQSSGRLANPTILPEEAMRQPARFVTALAHEVRNPLTNINLAVDMLECADKDDDPKLYLDIIKRGSARINHLICDLLNTRSRIRRWKAGIPCTGCWMKFLKWQMTGSG